MNKQIKSLIMLPISLILLGLTCRGIWEIFNIGWSVFGWL